MKKELLSIPEAAELLSCSTRTVRRLIEERTIEACKLRSSTRVVYASLQGYIRKRTAWLNLNHPDKKV
jgi:excisionase family DNA binding protein